MLNRFNTQTTFNGKFSKETINMFSKTLDNTQLKAAKAFRTGKNKMDKFSIKYTSEPIRDNFGRQFLKTTTYMEVVAANSKRPPLRLYLSEGKLPFGRTMLNLITNKIAFVDKLRK